MSRRKRCSACGNGAGKTVRALILKSDAPPRMGLVCRVCAACGTLVVPATLRMLPAKPKKVTKTRALPKLLADVELVRGTFEGKLRDAIENATPDELKALAKIALGRFTQPKTVLDEMLDEPRDVSGFELEALCDADD